MNIVAIVWDMDGTIADLYSIENWEQKLRQSDPSPYATAHPIFDMARLNALLTDLRAVGIMQVVVSWLSMDSTKEYKDAVRQAKRDWLDKYGFPYDAFHGVAYGSTKANAVRKLAALGDVILVDDNPKVRRGWHLGPTIDPTEGNLLEILEELARGD